jgi:hypothetical protein
LAALGVSLLALIVVAALLGGASSGLVSASGPVGGKHADVVGENFVAEVAVVVDLRHELAADEDGVSGREVVEDVLRGAAVDDYVRLEEVRVPAAALLGPDGNRHRRSVLTDYANGVAALGAVADVEVVRYAWHRQKSSVEEKIQGSLLKETF